MKRQSCVCGEIVYCGVVLLVNEVRSGGEEKHIVINGVDMLWCTSS